MNPKPKAFLALLLACLLLASVAQPAFAARPTHGTSDQWITEDMLTTKAPSSYRIDPATQADAKEGRYNAYFLKDRLQTVSITMDTDHLNYLVQHATDEPYVMTKSVTIGDTTLGYCGLRTKGNFTLHHAYTDNPGSDRFSFTVNFGEYVDKANFGQKQNFYGCERISFNNFYFDKSMMKEFFALMLMEEMGLPTPQFGLAKLYINGEYYGVYAMVEALDETILEQHYQLDGKDLSSYLCKPTGTRFRYSDLYKDPAPLYEHSDETYAQVADMLPTALEWARKLNCLSSGTDFAGDPIDVQSEEYLALLAQVMDVEETVKYFAVHSWLCQMDNMFVGLQNFGLYLSPQGVSTLLPWDYDLAFGCYFPSTAENTANYPINVMYQLNSQMWEEEQKHSGNFYKTFPLFYVIYQNESLMADYRQYMLECSQVAALGGTVESTGKAYAPAYFNSFIEKLETALLEAASEPLAKNVYYMNHIQQPKDVKAALPNLTRIIAQRAVGVYNQVTGSDAWVCGSGCNLESLGNALRGENTRTGLLTLVDPYTGIFTTAQYAGNRNQTPVLGVAVLGEADAAYQSALTALGAEKGQALLVYQLRSAVKPTGGFDVTIPLDGNIATEEAQHRFYYQYGEKLVELTPERNGNLYQFHLDQLGTVVVALDQSALPSASPVLLLAAASVAVAVLAVAVVFVARRKKKA